MILKELNLIGFGKFENKSIHLNKGINVIYGENEAGKSTLHSFIEGMFFGFLRPNVKTALYKKQHSKYDPWNNNRYAGILRFEYEGKDYRIERDFRKGNEGTKIFEEITGNEISKYIETGRTRISQPGIHFFGFNTRVFSNTIFIKQLQSITDKKLANDIRERLINVNTSLDDNISVEKAISDIESYLSQIGSEKAYTKPYAINLKNIKELEEEKEKIQINKTDYEFLLEEKSSLEEEKSREEKNLSKLSCQLKKIKILEKKKILEEGEKITKEIKSLELDKEKLKIYANASREDYDNAIKLNETIEYKNKLIKNIELQLKSIRNKIETFNPSNIKSPNTHILKDLDKDYNFYENLEREKQEIKYSKDRNYIRILQRDKEANKDKEKKHKRNSFILIIVTVITVLTLYLNEISTIFLLIPMLIIGFIIIYYIMGQKEIDKEKKKIKTDLEKISFQEKSNSDKIENINKDLENLLLRNNVKTKSELKSLVDKFKIEIYSRDEKQRQYNEAKQEKSKLEEELKENKDKKKEDIKLFNQILLKNKCKNLKEFSLALDNKEMYEKRNNDLTYKKELLKKSLGKYTLDELSRELNERKTVIDYEIETNEEDLLNNIELKKNRISEIKIELVAIEEKLKILDKKISKLVEIEEEIYRKIEDKKSLENKISALNLAKSTIETLSEEIHTEFAPSINKKLSRIVEMITSGKYNNIKINEDLDISLENPLTNEIINIEDLSGGTIDQLYFALRFGIIDEITEKELPLFLDDCFIQYDDNRLKNVLNFLINKKKNRQVLLFTCHKREKKTLEDLGVNFKFINLS